jgi:hypothetical protein
MSLGPVAAWRPPKCSRSRCRQCFAHRIASDQHGAGFVEDVRRQRNETRSNRSQSFAFDLLPPRNVQVVAKPPHQSGSRRHLDQAIQAEPQPWRRSQRSTRQLWGHAFEAVVAAGDVSKRRPRLTTNHDLSHLSPPRLDYGGPSPLRAAKGSAAFAIHPTKWYGTLTANLPNRQRNQNSGKHATASPRALFVVQEKSPRQFQILVVATWPASAPSFRHRQAIAAFTPFALTRYVKIIGSKF